MYCIEKKKSKLVGSSTFKLIDILFFKIPIPVFAKSYMLKTKYYAGSKEGSFLISPITNILWVEPMLSKEASLFIIND